MATDKKISVATLRSTLDGTEQLPVNFGGSPFKILVSAIKDYVISLFTNKETVLDLLTKTVNNRLAFNGVELPKKTPIIDKGVSDPVTFSLADDAVQKVMLETSSLTIAFSNLPTDYSTTNLLRLHANGGDATVSFTGLTAANWVDNSPLSVMSDNSFYEISITTFGSNLADATLGWVKIGA